MFGILIIPWLSVYAQGCVTEEKLTVVNSKVIGIVLELAGAGAITYAPEHGTAEVNGDIQDLLSIVCNTTSVVDLLQDLKEEISVCPQLLNQSTYLQMLAIDVVDLHALFTDFDSISAFCQCKVYVGAAWALRMKNYFKTSENPAWVYNITAQGRTICGNEEDKLLISTVQTTSEVCREATEKQAALINDEKKLKFHSLVKLVMTEGCTSEQDGMWDCIQDTSEKPAFHFCLSWASALDSNKAACGKRMCVDTYMDNCPGTRAPDLYIAAVNVENPGALPEMNQTCLGCGHGLLGSWTLKDKHTELLHTDPQAAYTNIGNVENICGPNMTENILGIVSSPSECKSILEEEAGFPTADGKTFADLYGIVQKCNSMNITSDWRCAINVATSNDFKTCIAEEENKIPDQALCGKWKCVESEMQGCGKMARDLYIRAVNLENTGAIRETYDGCDGAASLCFSLMTLVACVYFSVI